MITYTRATCTKWYISSSTIFTIQVPENDFNHRVRVQIRRNNNLIFDISTVVYAGAGQTYNLLYINSMRSDSTAEIIVDNNNWIPLSGDVISVIYNPTGQTNIVTQTITVPATNQATPISATLSTINSNYTIEEQLSWVLQYSKVDNGVDNNIRSVVYIYRVYSDNSESFWAKIYDDNEDVTNTTLRTLSGSYNIAGNLTIGHRYRIIVNIDYDSCNTLNRRETEIRSSIFTITPAQEVITAELNSISDVGTGTSFNVHTEASALIDDQVNATLDLVNVATNTKTNIFTVTGVNSPYTRDESQTISTAGQYRYELTVASNDNTAISKTVTSNNFNVLSREVIVSFGTTQPSYDIGLINSITIPITIQNNSNQNATYRIHVINPNSEWTMITSGNAPANTTTTVSNTTFFPNIVGRWVLAPLVDFVTFKGLDITVINSITEEFIKEIPDRVEVRSNLPGLTTTVEEIPNNSYALSFSPELKGWDSIHRTIPQKYISRNLMVFDNGNIATIGRRASFQHSIIEKVVKFNYYSIVEFIRILNEDSNPSFITIKSYKFSTDRMEYSTFENYGEKIIINEIRSTTPVNDNIVARGNYEQNFNNSYNNIAGTEFEDRFIEGEYCIIRLEYFSPFKLFNIDVKSRKQDI